MKVYGSIFRNKNFLLLWAGQGVSTVGNRFYSLAIMWYLLEETGSSLALGTSVLCITLPTIFVMPFSGVLADKNFKKQILVGTDLVNGLLMLFTAYMVMTGQFPLWSIYLIMVLSSMVTALFTPAVSASIPLLVGREELARANSMSQMTTQTSNILGPALAGILIAMTDIWLLFLINGISYLISSFSELFIKIPPVKSGEKKMGFFEQFREGLTTVLDSKKLLLLLISGGVIINFFLAPVSVYLTFISNEIESIGSEGLGFINSSISLGALVVSVLVITKLIKNKIKMAVFGLAIEGVSLVLGGMFLNLFGLMISMFILGLGVSLASIGISTLYQSMVPDHLMGRVGSVLSTMSTFIVPMGAMVGSLAINYYSLTVILVCSGVIVFLNGILLRIPFHEEYKKGNESVATAV